MRRCQPSRLQSPKNNTQARWSRLSSCFWNPRRLTYILVSVDCIVVDYVCWKAPVLHSQGYRAKYKQHLWHYHLQSLGKQCSNSRTLQHTSMLRSCCHYVKLLFWVIPWTVIPWIGMGLQPCLSDCSLRLQVCHSMLSLLNFCLHSVSKCCRSLEDNVMECCSCNMMAIHASFNTKQVCVYLMWS